MNPQFRRVAGRQTTDLRQRLVRIKLKHDLFSKHGFESAIRQRLRH